jgi:hypothetical protein
MEKFNLMFNKAVQGYHMISATPISETLWEDINTLILRHSDCEIHSTSSGSHLSGMDIDSSFGRLSNKSTKYSKQKKFIDISSYRLTTVCSEKTIGDPLQIIEEINKRKNFDYYSIIIREEQNQEIEYDWLLIPSNHDVLNPSSYEWEPTIGKRGKNKGTQVGWHTNKKEGCNMSIVFGMSSQLWIHVEMTEEIKSFIVARTKITNNPKYNYIELASL